MIDKSSTAAAKDKMIRLSELYPDIQTSAISDSQKDNTLYTVPSYVRQILQVFIDAKKINPGITPKSFKIVHR